MQIPFLLIDFPIWSRDLAIVQASIVTELTIEKKNPILIVVIVLIVLKLTVMSTAFLATIAV